MMSLVRARTGSGGLVASTGACHYLAHQNEVQAPVVKAQTLAPNKHEVFFWKCTTAWASIKQLTPTGLKVKSSDSLVLAYVHVSRIYGDSLLYHVIHTKEISNQAWLGE